MRISIPLPSHTKQKKEIQARDRKKTPTNSKYIYVVDGKEFENVYEVAEAFDITINTVYYRAGSKFFPNWSKIAKEET